MLFISVCYPTGEYIMDDRSRVFVVITYPEHWSSEVDLDFFLGSLHIPACRSPLHHGMLDDFVQIERKDHWHVLLAFEGKKSFAQVEDLLGSAFTKPQKCQSIKGSVRYFVHADNPEKEQLSFNDIRCFGGFNAQDNFAPTSSQRSVYIRQMQDWIIESRCTNYAELVDFANKTHFDTWAFVLNSGACYQMATFIKSYSKSSLLFDGIVID